MVESYLKHGVSNRSSGDPVKASASSAAIFFLAQYTESPPWTMLRERATGIDGLGPHFPSDRRLRGGRFRSHRKDGRFSFIEVGQVRRINLRVRPARDIQCHVVQDRPLEFTKQPVHLLLDFGHIADSR
ncbi:MAG: hypothetical protein U0231_10470 [Nitrospiraceae bacterium]